MIIRGFLDSSFSPPAPAAKAFISIEKLKVKGSSFFSTLEPLLPPYLTRIESC
jgi:hypothetical protein